MRDEFASSATPVGCYFRHFLPERLVVRYDETEEEARSIASVISEVRPGLRTRAIRRPVLHNTLIPKVVIDLLKERLGDVVTPILYPPRRIEQLRLMEDQEAETLTLRDWYERTSRLSPRYREALYDKLKADQQLADDIFEIVKKQGRTRELGEGRYALQPYRPEDLFDAAHRLDRYFTSSVKYIGPLRDEPKPVYPLAAAEDHSCRRRTVGALMLLGQGVCGSSWLDERSYVLTNSNRWAPSSVSRARNLGSESVWFRDVDDHSRPRV